MNPAAKKFKPTLIQISFGYLLAVISVVLLIASYQASEQFLEISQPKITSWTTFFTPTTVFAVWCALLFAASKFRLAFIEHWTMLVYSIALLPMLVMAIAGPIVGAVNRPKERLLVQQSEELTNWLKNNKRELLSESKGAIEDLKWRWEIKWNPRQTKPNFYILHPSKLVVELGFSLEQETVGYQRDPQVESTRGKVIFDISEGFDNRKTEDVDLRFMGTVYEGLYIDRSP